MAALGVRKATFTGLSVRDRTILKHLGSILQLGEPAEFVAPGGAHWFVFDDHRFKAKVIAYLGCVLANLAEIPSGYELPTDGDGELDKSQMRSDIRTFCESPSRGNPLVWPVQGGSWQEILDAQGTPAVVQMGFGVPRDWTAFVPQTVTVSPGDNLQLLVDQNQAGSIYVLDDGEYRMQSVKPKSGDTFEAAVGATVILNGSRLLSQWVSNGTGLWSHSGQDQEPILKASVRVTPGREGARANHDLFVDDVPLEQVMDIAELTSGSWFFDYPNDTIWIADDPTDHKLETSVTVWAFNDRRGYVSDVTIRNLVIEKYANPAQQSAIFTVGAIWQGGVVTAERWIIEDNEFRLNHGSGINISDLMIVRNNWFHHNGQTGLRGGGLDVLIEGNEINNNNIAGFDRWWDAGGMKLARTEGLVVRNNDVHDNFGYGIWLDIDNINTLIETNHVYENALPGIYEEISYDAVIRNNLVEHNGFDESWRVAGAGIFVNSSSNIEIYDNTVIGNMDGIAAMAIEHGSGAYGRHKLRDLYVHDNRIEMTVGQTGIILVAPLDDPSVFDGNNRFENNTYKLGAEERYYEWDGSAMTKNEWVAAGNDTTGTWTAVSP